MGKITIKGGEYNRTNLLKKDKDFLVDQCIGLKRRVEMLEQRIRAATVVTATPISDKNNLSLNSEGDRDFGAWIYGVALLLDMIIPVQGYSNAQRIEMAINIFKQLNEDS